MQAASGGKTSWSRKHRISQALLQDDSHLLPNRQPHRLPYFLQFQTRDNSNVYKFRRGPVVFHEDNFYSPDILHTGLPPRSSLWNHQGPE